MQRRVVDFVRVGYFIPLNGPLNGHPPSDVLYLQSVADVIISHIYTIIRHKSVHVRKLQVAILAQSFWEMSLTDRILPRYILSRVHVSVRPRNFFMREKTANHSRPHTDLRPPQLITAQRPDKQLNWKRRNPSSSVAQCEELSAKTLLKLVWSAAIRVQNPCGEQYFFVNALSKQIGDFLSKTIHYTRMPIHIIIRKMLFFHTFIRDSCSVGLLL